MADIFLSYARQDLTKVEGLAVTLVNIGWSVFWDKTNLLAGQDVDEVIEQEIEQAGCMVVAWSKASRRSDWVRGEADIARKQNKLVPIRFELIDPPIAFRTIHTDDLINWNGDPDSKDFKKLLLALTRLISSPIANDNKTLSVQAIGISPVKPSKPMPSRSIASYESSPVFIEPEMVIIPAGGFQMGSCFNKREKPIHTVTFAKPFSIAKNLVTFDQYDIFSQASKRQLPDDQGWGRDQRPVINISREDASEYASWLSKLSGKSYRLPSEAEWEYVVRANTTSEYYWGDQGKAEDFSWFDENSENKTHPVAEKKPNVFGLYDMSGNVSEWVQDDWHENYHNAPIDGSAWESSERYNSSVLRGGALNSTQDCLRSAYRSWTDPDDRLGIIGFRLAQD